MKIKARLWKIFTLLLIGLMMLNPEFIALGVFIDAVGLEMFSLLIEVQIASVVGYYFHHWIKPVLMPFYRWAQKIDPYFFIPAHQHVKQYPALLCHAIPGLVVLAIGGTVVNTDANLI